MLGHLHASHSAALLTFPASNRSMLITVSERIWTILSLCYSKQSALLVIFIMHMDFNWFKCTAEISSVLCALHLISWRWKGLHKDVTVLWAHFMCCQEKTVTLLHFGATILPLYFPAFLTLFKKWLVLTVMWRYEGKLLEYKSTHCCLFRMSDHCKV